MSAERDGQILTCQHGTRSAADGECPACLAAPARKDTAKLRAAWQGLRAALAANTDKAGTP